jgi:hypothetical protein
VSSTEPHTHIHTKFQICHNTPKVSEVFIKRDSKTEERATAAEGALSFHTAEHYAGHNCRVFLSQNLVPLVKRNNFVPLLLISTNLVYFPQIL